MKDIFSGFYTLSENDLNNVLKSDETIFIFDTCVLLSLYSYTEDTRNDFYKIFKELKKSIWIPYHVGLEYQLQRLTVIKNEKAVYRNLKKYLSKISDIFDKEIKNLDLKKRSENLNKLVDDLKNNINKLVDDFENNLDKIDEKQPCVRSSDDIRKKLDYYFANKVGNKPYGQEQLDEIFKDGENRYKNKIPPGYKDDVKQEDFVSFDGLVYKKKYGDLIIWKQIIEKVKDEKIKNVFFITDDLKEDWIFKIDSGGKKDIGVRAELRQEIQKIANAEIFEIYNSVSFIEIVNEKLLTKKIKHKTIDEVKLSGELNKYLKNQAIINKNIEKEFNNTIKINKDYANIASENLIKRMKELLGDDSVSKLFIIEKVNKEINDLQIRLNDAIKNEDFEAEDFYNTLIKKKIDERDRYRFSRYFNDDK